jgi:2-hydroxy-6-oxonona-2,4-dienedioate hydrolase
MSEHFTADFWPGEPGRPTVTLIPGLFAGGWIWDAQVTALRMLGWPILRIREAICSLGRAAGDIGVLGRHVIDLVGDRTELVLCGASIGGSIALYIGAHYPEQVRGVVASGVPGFGAGFDSGLAANDRLKLDKLRDWVAGACFHDPDSVDRGYLDRLRDTIGTDVVGTLRGSRAIERHEVLADASHQKAPTLYIWGDDDAIAPLGSWVQDVRSRPETVEFSVIDECGHLPCLERPEEYNPQLLDFLILLLDQARS